ncbi:hypothetical protein GCM10029963_34580 [Micromonospora andamanensis]
MGVYASGGVRHALKARDYSAQSAHTRGNRPTPDISRHRRIRPSAPVTSQLESGGQPIVVSVTHVAFDANHPHLLRPLFQGCKCDDERGSAPATFGGAFPTAPSASVGGVPCDAAALGAS